VHAAWLPNQLRWLMGRDPGGFKLNEPVNRALGTCVLALLRAWNVALSWALAPLPPPSSLLLGLVPFLCVGASVGVAVASDLLLAACVHLRLLYTSIAYVYGGYCACLYALFNLFRGKKYNERARRAYSHNYDAEQRLLGTLLFSVLVLLLPTVAAYHVLASMLWLGTLAAQSLLLLLLLLLEDFPW
jgi:phosphatidylinositol glycan class Q protein